ncbi:unnamed protein product [Mytilus edulis]|uniref:Uncharacterized protein n=1 Tax=Mytilus edulis TaxID=6550 RepID=A0A8S3R7P7_MYTED|nr:unnamed protein product [Mytilus edulis]
MEMKERLLIPVLKEACEIPDYLKPFTYIDARGSMDSWLPMLVSAIESEGHRNLEILHEESSQFNCTGSVFHTSYIPQILFDEPINLPADLFSETMKSIAGTQIDKGRHCRSCWWPTILFWTFFLVTYDRSTRNFSIRQQLYIPGYWQQATSNSASRGSDLYLCGFCGICISCSITSWKEYVKTSLKKMSELKMDSDLELYPSSANQSLLSVNLEIETQPTGTQRLQTDRASNEEIAQNMLLDLSIPYLQDFLSERLVCFSDTRHSTRAVCICQYAEMKGLIKKQLKFEI